MSNASRGKRQLALNVRYADDKETDFKSRPNSFDVKDSFISFQSNDLSFKYILIEINYLQGGSWCKYCTCANLNLQDSTNAVQSATWLRVDLLETWKRCVSWLRTNMADDSRQWRDDLAECFGRFENSHPRCFGSTCSAVWCLYLQAIMRRKVGRWWVHGTNLMKHPKPHFVLCVCVCVINTKLEMMTLWLGCAGGTRLRDSQTAPDLWTITYFRVETTIMYALNSQQVNLIQCFTIHIS